jgi:hypothetical protein
MGAFNFKDYDIIHSSVYDRSPEEKLAAFILHTFIIDAQKISVEFNRSTYIDRRNRTIRVRGRKYAYNELSAPPLNEFLNDLHGKMCEYYCDVLDFDYMDFITRIKRILPEELVKKR